MPIWHTFLMALSLEAHQGYRRIQEMLRTFPEHVDVDPVPNFHVDTDLGLTFRFDKAGSGSDLVLM